MARAITCVALRACVSVCVALRACVSVCVALRACASVCASPRPASLQLLTHQYLENLIVAQLGTPRRLSAPGQTVIHLGEAIQASDLIDEVKLGKHHRHEVKDSL